MKQLRTISTTCRDQATLTQYSLLRRADEIFTSEQYNFAGRYYGGALTDEEYQHLTDGIKLQ